MSKQPAYDAVVQELVVRFLAGDSRALDDVQNSLNALAVKGQQRGQAFVHQFPGGGIGQGLDFVHQLLNAPAVAVHFIDRCGVTVGGRVVHAAGSSTGDSSSRVKRTVWMAHSWPSVGSAALPQVGHWRVGTRRG